jgi:uncharacterized membrane protein YesL
MNIINSRFYQWLEVATNFFLLNVIWFLTCIPIITIFPATTAMFGVIRQWKIKDDTRVFSLFFKMFKENFKQSFIIGILWGIVAIILYIDFQFILQVDSTLQMILFPFFMLLTLLLSFITVYLFPVMVHYDTNLVGVIKNSFVLSISNLVTTFLSLFVLIGMYATFLIIPLSIFVLFSLTAYFIYTLCNRAFEKINLIKEKADKS